MCIAFTRHMPIDKNVRSSCNAGYLFLQDIYYSLGLNNICKSISEKYKLSELDDEADYDKFFYKDRLRNEEFTEFLNKS